MFFYIPKRLMLDFYPDKNIMKFGVDGIHPRVQLLVNELPATKLPGTHYYFRL